MPFVLQTMPLRKLQEVNLEVAEMKMLRFSLGVSRVDRIKTEYNTEQQMSQVLGIKSERVYGDYLDMSREEILNISVEGC